jgi:hypothetical protein
MAPDHRHPQPAEAPQAQARRHSHLKHREAGAATNRRPPSTASTIDPNTAARTLYATATIQSNERLVEMALGIYFQHGGFTPEKYADALSRLEAA